MPRSVSSGEGSTSAGPLCSPFISAPSPVAANGGEPSGSGSGTLALVPKNQRRTRQGRGVKISLSSHKVFEQADQWNNITVETSVGKPRQGCFFFQEGHHKSVFLLGEQASVCSTALWHLLRWWCYSTHICTCGRSTDCRINQDTVKKKFLLGGLECTQSSKLKIYSSFSNVSDLVLHYYLNDVLSRYCYMRL